MKLHTTFHSKIWVKISLSWYLYLHFCHNLWDISLSWYLYLIFCHNFSWYLYLIFCHNPVLSDIFIMKRKFIKSHCQQFNEYQQNEQLPLNLKWLNTKKPMMYVMEILELSWGRHKIMVGSIGYQDPNTLFKWNFKHKINGMYLISCHDFTQWPIL